MSEIDYNNVNGKMIFISKRKKTKIVFDAFEYVDEEEASEYDAKPYFWADMCSKHHNMYKNVLGKRCSYNGSPEAECLVEGCEELATWYVDFAKDEVKIETGF